MRKKYSPLTLVLSLFDLNDLLGFILKHSNDQMMHNFSLPNGRA